MASRVHQVLTANTDKTFTITPTAGMVEVTNHGVTGAAADSNPIYVEVGAAATVRGNDTRAVGPGASRLISTGNRTGTVAIHVISEGTNEVSVEAVTPGSGGFFH